MSLKNFLITLYATNEYGFGITSGALMYHSMGSHNFYTNQVLKASIDNAGVITASGFSGSGASLNNLAYGNITGKPTNFQADWLSTVINKPSTFTPDTTNIYTKTETNNLITSSSNYTSNASNALKSFIDATNTNLTNNYLALSGGTMSGPITNTSTTASRIDFLNIYHSSLSRTSHLPFGDNKIYLRAPVIIDFDNLSFGSREQNFLIYLYGTEYGFGVNAYTLRYNCPAFASHKFYTGPTNIATISDTGVISCIGGFSGSGANITDINYNNITLNKPDLTLYNGWTKSGNDIYNTSFNNGKVGIGLTNPNGYFEIKSDYLSTSSRLKTPKLINTKT